MKPTLVAGLAVIRRATVDRELVDVAAANNGSRPRREPAPRAAALSPAHARANA
jgi:hypothetical protein